MWNRDGRGLAADPAGPVAALGGQEPEMLRDGTGPCEESPEGIGHGLGDVLLVLLKEWPECLVEPASLAQSAIAFLSDARKRRAPAIAFLRACTSFSRTGLVLVFI